MKKIDKDECYFFNYIDTFTTKLNDLKELIKEKDNEIINMKNNFDNNNKNDITIEYFDENIKFSNKTINKFRQSIINKIIDKV